MVEKYYIAVDGECCMSYERLRSSIYPAQFTKGILLTGPETSTVEDVGDSEVIAKPLYIVVDRPMAPENPCGAGSRP